MESFGASVGAAFQLLKKHFFAVAGVSLASALVSFLPTILFADSPWMILLLLIPNILFQTWAFIAIFQIVTEDKFDINWQVQRFRERFNEWLWASLAVIHICFKAVFPFLFPAILRGAELLLTNSSVLFGTNTQVDALKQSRAILKGQVWHLLGFMILFAGLIPQGLIKLAAHLLGPSLVIPVSIVATGLATTVTTCLFVSLYTRRANLTGVEPEPGPVDYKRQAMENFPRAILGFFWLMLLVIGFTVLFVMVAKNSMPQPG